MPIDYDSLTFSELAKLGMQNDSIALTMLGLAYMYGDYNVNPNMDMASSYFERAHTLGHKGAAYLLGQLFNDFDKEKAFLWYEKAASYGFSDAMYELSKFYMDGVCVEKDLVRSFQLLTNAVNEGCENANFLLGQCYEKGLGTDSNKALALKHYLSVDSPMSKYYAGRLLLNADDKANNKYAFQLLNEALNGGVLDAYCELGNCYLMGKGVPIDVDKAIELFEKSAEENSIRGKLLYANSIILNDTAKELIGYTPEERINNLKKALDWIENLDEKYKNRLLEIQLLTHIGDCYLREGIEKKDKHLLLLAKSRLEIGASNNHPNALVELGLCLIQLSEKPDDYIQIPSLLSNAINNYYDQLDKKFQFAGCDMLMQI